MINISKEYIGPTQGLSQEDIAFLDDIEHNGLWCDIWNTVQQLFIRHFEGIKNLQDADTYNELMKDVDKTSNDIYEKCLDLGAKHFKNDMIEFSRFK